MDFVRFSVYSFIGSLTWSFVLVYLGYTFTNKWDQLQNYLQKFNILVLACLANFLGFYYFWRRKYSMNIKTKIQRLVCKKPAQPETFGKCLAIGSILAILAILLFGNLAEDLLSHELTVFDSSFTTLIGEFSTPAITRIMKCITVFGSLRILIPVAIAAIFMLYKKKKPYWDSLLVVMALSGGWLLSELLKSIFHRPRPELTGLVEVSGYSFPSGHAMVSVAFYGFLAYLLWFNLHHSKLRFPATFAIVILIVLIGISRIYLGVHYPSDVLAGFAAGGFWLTVCALTYNLLNYHQSLNNHQSNLV